MGIHSLLQLLPGGSFQQEQHRGFFNLPLQEERVVLDAASLLFQCALKEAKDYREGSYLPALKKFQEMIIYFQSLCRWKMYVVFDGMESELKQYERVRRDTRADKDPDNSIRNDPMYILMAYKICEDRCIPCIIAHKEADSQCKHVAWKGLEPTLVVTGDSDLLAFGNRRVMVVSSWFAETYRLIDISRSNLEGFIEKIRQARGNSGIEIDTCLEARLVFVQSLLRFGDIILWLYAGVVGCDFTPDPSGLPGPGKDAFISALISLEKRESLSTESFAESLFELSQHVPKLSREETTAYLQKVVNCFTKRATYYCLQSQTINDVSGAVLGKADIQHAMGKKNPRTGEQLTSEQAKLLGELKVHNLLFKSDIDHTKHPLYGIPNGRQSLKDCTNVELMAFIGAREGNTTSELGKNMNKQELLVVAASNLSLQKLAPSCIQLRDWHPDASGLFIPPSLQLKHKSEIGAFLAKYLALPQMMRDEFGGIRDMIREVLHLRSEHRFMETVDAIAQHSPELKLGLIYRRFGYVGENVKQKSLRVALDRCLAQSKALYHGVAFSENRKKFYIVSMQYASMKSDPSTKKVRDDADIGKAPELQPYLVLQILNIHPTTVEVHGHAQGILDDVIVSYCASCAAGLGNCIHKTKSLFTQYIHWGRDREVELSTTINKCQWNKGAKRKVDMKTPVQNYEIRAKRSKDTSAAKQVRNANLGLSAHYNVYSTEAKCRRAFDDQRFSSERMRRFLEALRKPDDSCD